MRSGAFVLGATASRHGSVWLPVPTRRASGHDPRNAGTHDCVLTTRRDRKRAVGRLQGIRAGSGVWFSVPTVSATGRTAATRSRRWSHRSTCTMTRTQRVSSRPWRGASLCGSAWTFCSCPPTAVASSSRSTVDTTSGRHHFTENAYTEQEKPSPRLYAQMAAEDRRIQLAGYEVRIELYAVDKP